MSFYTKLFWVWAIVGHAWLTSCCSGDIANSQEAKRGYELCDPIIDSIEAYAVNNNGFFPNDIDWIEKQFPPSLQKEMKELALDYITTDSLKEYSLSFSYVTGPINACTWSSKTDAWTCESYY